MSGGKRIALLLHERDRDHRPRYLVQRLADFWREDGHEVVELCGAARSEPADVAILHVNLSVVPQPYLDLAARFPVTLNVRARDIRKSSTSRNLLRPGDAWQGPVIVKSDLNFGGRPERRLEPRLLDRLAPDGTRRRRAAVAAGLASPIATPRDYRVFERLDDVPRRLRRRRDLVVERFLPECEDGLYHTRMYQFLGDHERCARIGSPSPILKAGTAGTTEWVEPHPEARAWRAALGLDYGKIDYVVHEGTPVLLDANKTTGLATYGDPDELVAARRHQAEGLYSYFA